MPVILLSMKTIESLQNGLQPYSGENPLFSMRAVSLAPAQLTLTLGVNGPLKCMEKVITARKRSLGQHNIFYTCLSGDGGKGSAQPPNPWVQTLAPQMQSPLLDADPPPLPQYILDTTGYGQQAAGTYPTRVHTCL